jgi:DNA polymerase-1
MEFSTLTKRVAEGLGVEAPPPLERSVGSSLKPSKPDTPKPNGAASATVNGAETPAAAVAFGLAAAH